MIFRVVFVSIVLLAFFLRFINISHNPPSLTWDEVSWGYNAYSILLDGRDEFGRFIPLAFLESFGDFKPPMYAYLTVLPVLLFGLSEFSVRFVSAFFGSISVLITFFLVRKLFIHENNRNSLALVASFILCVSPWHINLSRAAFEANVASFFIISGVFFFLEATNKRPYLLILSVISFVFSIYTFNTARIVSPFLVLLLVVGFRKELFRIKSAVGLSTVVGLLLLIPTVGFLFSPQARLRFNEVNIFSDVDVVRLSNQYIENDNNALWSKVLHNRRVGFALSYLHHYFDHFSPDFLFFRGDGNPKFSTREVGQLYLFELPFLILGILILFRRRPAKWWIIPSWLLIGIIPAATARETPHALRIETILPTLQVLTAYGIIVAFSWVKHIRTRYILKYAIITVFCIIVVSNILYYLHGYHVHYPKQFSGEWQYGYKEAIAYAQTVYDDYDKIYLTESLGRPYIYVLFYTKYDPRRFRIQAEIERDNFGFVHVYGFDKWNFAKEFSTFEDKEKTVKTLYIDAPGNVPQNASIKKTFYLLSGEPVLQAYER